MVSSSEVPTNNKKQIQIQIVKANNYTRKIKPNNSLPVDSHFFTLSAVGGNIIGDKIYKYEPSFW